MPMPAVVQRIISWLRAGYPEGVPEHDYIPLLALLGRHFSQDDIIAVASELIATGELETAVDPSAAVSDAIAALTDSPASEIDIARVRAHLESVGWDFEPVSGA
jgi:hypothetical protein